MIEEYFELSRKFIKTNNQPYLRYFLKEYKMDNKFSIITGQRGVGKTTAIIQYILMKYGDPLTKKAIYIPSDHFLVGKTSIYEIAEEFNDMGGELICFDEIHKYREWSKELKSINDTFADLKIIASGSSALEISKGTNDLSRRAIRYAMHGLSFREYLELFNEITLEKYSLVDILKNHENITYEIIDQLEKNNKIKILPQFKEYLFTGYYPYFNEFTDRFLFYITLDQNIHTTLESDLISVHPNITGSSLKKIKQLLSIIASSVPFKPDLKSLKKLLDIGDERTLKTYFKYLEEAGIINSISQKKGGLSELEKPEKIYLNNTNQIYAIQNENNVSIGNVRETFFLNAVSAKHNVTAALKGDFMIDNEFIIEVGGKNKDFKQIKGTKKSYLAIDSIEKGVGNRIPLWLFGFLY